ncbi:MAG: permease [Bacillota bacterium]|nr:permease [Bacillota bacterium]MDW7678076.1 permease [Bacillota bacterium]
MNKTTLGMGTAALLLAGAAFYQGGLTMVGSGLFIGAKTLVSIVPILVMAFLVAGFVNVLISKGTVSRWLGKEAGWKGPFYGSLLGAMVPGGPFFFYPLMATLILQGASVGTMISFVAAKTLWNIGRLPMEIAFVGSRLTVIRFLVTFAIPILAGGAINLFFPGLADKIREDVTQLQLRRPPVKDGDRRD